GYVKLLDFGLARTVTEAVPDVKKTDPFIVRGTVFYMSPEQLRGKPLDTRSDIWSVGVVMYELISGRLPFEGDSSSDIAAHVLRSDPPPLTRRDNVAVPPRLAAIVDRAMQKDRLNRYPSARTMLDDLELLRTDLEQNA